ncbi:MAG: hypothetical protein CVU59_10295 [Deltaproteobacteria bacterium HGW-Deltaproteobacteria-17]|nr:MAG: hypothetical protein CVU59_10295 [Deltaproteobacteria bacterium HGW-Deltaproteobacteria-17]
MYGFLKKLTWISAWFACFGLMLLSLQRLHAQRAFIPQNMDSFYLPSEKVLRVASLGYRHMLADLMWVKTLMYFGTEMNGQKRQTWLAAHAWRVIALDPSFELAYQWAGAAMLYGGRIIDNETVLMSNEFYRAAMKRFPHNWRYRSALAFNLVYEYKAATPEEAERNREEAIGLFREASRMAGAPPYLKIFAITQMTKAGMNKLAAEYVREAYASAQDEEERTLLARRLKDLDKGEGAAELDYQQERLTREYNQALPYGSLELFLLLGPRTERLGPGGVELDLTRPKAGPVSAPDQVRP